MLKWWRELARRVFASESALLYLLGLVAALLVGIYTGVVYFAFAEQERRIDNKTALKTHLLWHATKLDDQVEANCETLGYVGRRLALRNRGLLCETLDAE